jgi:hypothetical protein
MGVLTARGLMSDDGSTAPEPAAAPAAAEPEGGEAPTKPEFVPFAKVDGGRKPGSRREQAERAVEEKIEARIKDYDAKQAAERTAYEQRIQAADAARQEQAQEIARLRGAMEAIQARPATPTVTAPAADPERLMEEAETALAAGDLRKYHAKVREATRAEAEQIADGRVKTMREELQRNQPAQVPWQIQSLVNQHRNVAMAGPQGLSWVEIKDRELALRGVPQGPQRLQKAFEMADKEIESVTKPTRPTGFSQDAAAALAATPTQRSNSTAAGGGSEPGYQPTEADKAVMDALKMKPTEFVKWKYPERWLKR